MENPENGQRFVRGAQNENDLWLSLDRKVSPGGWYQKNPGRWVPTVPNSFGLPMGITCPGKTPFCEGCYADWSERSPGVNKLVNHNYELLKRADQAGGTVAMAELLTSMVGIYRKEADRMGLPNRDRFFRIHWDGDFFSEDYADAWRMAMNNFPDIRFWTYTRSFVEPVDVVPILTPRSNLSLYLSTDKWNIGAAMFYAHEYGVNLALCAEDNQSAKALWPEPDYECYVHPDPKPEMFVCPERVGKIALMENGRGACTECRVCINGFRNVIFPLSKTELPHHQPRLWEEIIPVEDIKVIRPL